MGRPPKIIKYCGKCEALCLFAYNRLAGHSECTKCGWRFIPTLKVDDFQGFKEKSLEAWGRYDSDRMHPLKYKGYKESRPRCSP